MVTRQVNLKRNRSERHRPLKRVVIPLGITRCHPISVRSGLCVFCIMVFLKYIRACVRLPNLLRVSVGPAPSCPDDNGWTILELCYARRNGGCRLAPPPAESLPLC